MQFHTETIGPLKFYNSGASRSRIVLVAPAEGAVGTPTQLAGSRWLVFGQETAQALQALIAQRSLSQLQAALAPVGGLSASSFDKLRHQWALHGGEEGEWDGCHFVNFGQGNSRVLLVGRVPDGPIHPDRIGDTSIIVLSPAARHCFGLFLETLPGDTTAAYAAAAEWVPGGLSGRTILRARRATAAAG